MKQSKLLEMAGICSQHIIDGKPEEARVFLREHPGAIKKLRAYYAALQNYDEAKPDSAFWKKHASIAHEIVQGVMDESKRPKLPTAPSAEQSMAVYATDPYVDIGHGRTRVQHPLG